MTTVDTGSLPALNPITFGRVGIRGPGGAAGGEASMESATGVGEFDDFVVDRGPQLVRLARGLLRDPHQAEDVVQDVLSRALLRWGRIQQLQAPEAYVRRMVVNACTSWFRRAARRERPYEPATMPERVELDRVGVIDERHRMMLLLRTLSYRQRAVLVMRHYEGLTDREIAKVLGVSEPTVRSLAHRGLARLRETLRVQETAATGGAQ